MRRRGTTVFNFVFHLVICSLIAEFITRSVLASPSHKYTSEPSQEMTLLQMSSACPSFFEILRRHCLFALSP